MKVEKRLAACKGRKRSYQGKPFIINAIALSQIWRLCPVFLHTRLGCVQIGQSDLAFLLGMQKGSGSSPHCLLSQKRMGLRACRLPDKGECVATAMI